MILVGHVGKDPEVRHLEGGGMVARFPLATNESYVDRSGQRVSQTEWHNIVVWRGQAEVAEKYVKSGKLLYVEGRIRTNTYQDKEGGAKRYFTEIHCTNFRFLGPASGEVRTDEGKGVSQESDTPPKGEEDLPMPSPDDDLPF